MPTQPTAFDRLVQVLREMPEQKREDFAARTLRTIKQESALKRAEDPILNPEPDEKDEVWNKAFEDPGYLKKILDMAAQAEKAEQEGRTRPLDDFLKHQN